MNRIQRAYALAKAQHDAIKLENNQREAEFCAARGYKTEDGNPALHVWMIDDEALFEEANAEFCAMNEHGADAEIQAREVLKAAEDGLIEWGLSILPEGMRKEYDTLIRAVGQSLKTRNRIIDLAFRLDARTVPARVND